MLNLLFVHGTGVRSVSYLGSLEKIRTELEKRQPGSQVHACFWGDMASKLNAKGASVPGEQEVKLEDDSEARELARWAVLREDPLAEFRMMSSTDGDPFGSATGQALTDSFKNLNLAELLGDEGLSELVPECEKVRTWLLDQPRFKDAMKALGPSKTEASFAIARATVSELALRSSREYDQREADAPAQTDKVSNQEVANILQYVALENSEVRDRVVASLHRALVPGELLGLGDVWDFAWLGLGYTLSRKALTRQVDRRRGPITHSIFPIPGDILFYQARGEKIRNFIAKRIREIDGPVVILAHSLGAVAVMDILAQPATELKEKTLLVTVGSPVGLFYEINALVGLEFDKTLPSGFPPWLNIWDPLDVVAHLAAPVFKQHAGITEVEDFEVNNKETAIHAHNAYWNNDQVWEQINEWSSKFL